MSTRITRSRTARALITNQDASLQEANSKSNVAAETEPVITGKMKQNSKHVAAIVKAPAGHSSKAKGRAKKPSRQTAVETAQRNANKSTVQNRVADIAAEQKSKSVLPKQSSGKAKDDLRYTKPNFYRITLGTSPYPEFSRPTTKECHEVFKILEKAHGTTRSRPPEDFPVPSRKVAGCGNVKYILEAMIRTHMSAHTSNANANRAWIGLNKKFPRLTDGSCKNFVDWNSVRLASRQDLVDAIKSGGMAESKSKIIKQILDLAYEENVAMRMRISRKQLQLGSRKTRISGDGLSNSFTLRATDDTKVTPYDIRQEGDDQHDDGKDGRLKREDLDSDGPFGLDYEENQEVLSAIKKPLEILEKVLEEPENQSREAVMARFFNNTLLNEPDVLTLDYIHAMKPDDAFEKLVRFPGIGIKTAACVMLFSARQPFFAVDTHVFRISQWLGWVPRNATRDTTFAHLNVRCPNELKYGLHQLLIQHGQACKSCKAKAERSSEGEDDDCPLENLLERARRKKPAAEQKETKKRQQDDYGQGTDIENEKRHSTKRSKSKK